mmetsp:Transcript_38090/g.100612  ORF Transcript_38090/g.100612 Transcript_38090/m.100612 type:complete len:109 (-) Transcript_38090:34-360(-)
MTCRVAVHEPGREYVSTMNSRWCIGFSSACGCEASAPEKFGVGSPFMLYRFASLLLCACLQSSPIGAWPFLLHDLPRCPWDELLSVGLTRGAASLHHHCSLRTCPKAD